MIIIGIDPGVHTGYAEWHTELQCFRYISSLKILDAIDSVKWVDSCEREIGGRLVIWEDARLRTWFGTKGRESLQGAGSIKRDCGIWEEFFAATGISNCPVKPQFGGTKWTAPAFTKLTGWTERTNEHGRDAAMLVYGISSARASQMLGASTSARSSGTQGLASSVARPSASK